MRGSRIIIAMAAVVTATGCASTSVPTTTRTSAPRFSKVPDAEAVILRAQDRRQVDDAFRSTLADKRAVIRARAARAAGCISYPGAASDLEGLLEDPDPEVRGQAAFALGLVGSSRAAPRLIAMTHDPDPRVRQGVATALGMIGDGSALATLLRDPDPGVVAAACVQAVADLRPPTCLETRWGPGGHGSIVDAILDASESEDGSVQFAATYALSKLGSSAAAAGTDRRRVRDRLLALANHDDPEIRIQVANGLEAPESDVESKALAALSEDPDFRVRAAAVLALAHPGADVEPYFSKALRDPNKQVEAAAYLGLGRIGSNRAITLLLQGTGPEQPPWMRELAIEALGAADSTTLLSLAPRFLRADDPRIGTAALKGLAGRTDARTVDLFRQQLDSENPAHGAAAVEGLGAAGVPLAELEAPASSPEPAVRAAVAGAIGQRLATGEPDTTVDAGLDILARVWEASAGDAGVGPRLAVLRAAAQAGPAERARGLLEVGLDDPAWRVRSDAASGLWAEFGVDAWSRVGPAVDLPIEHYREVVSWSARPLAAIVTVRRRGYPPGRFTLSLTTEEAPLTAWRFAKLAQGGEWAGVRVSRIEIPRAFESGEPREAEGADRGYTPPREIARLPATAGTVGMASGDDGRWFLTFSHLPGLFGHSTIFARTVQNFPGVAALVQPDDEIVTIEMYEGDGTEPLPPSLQAR
jgi:HEAT repeat protein/cyclophilin family peptidyl-prolyl cis-trans isomerase